jgi:uncharacterized Fe-S radical SAM superfamily protein PflX
VFALVLKAPAQQQQAEDVLLACLTDHHLVCFVKCNAECAFCTSYSTSLSPAGRG